MILQAYGQLATLADSLLSDCLPLKNSGEVSICSPNLEELDVIAEALDAAIGGRGFKASTLGKNLKGPLSGFTAVDVFWCKVCVVGCVLLWLCCIGAYI